MRSFVLLILAALSPISPAQAKERRNHRRLCRCVQGTGPRNAAVRAGAIHAARPRFRQSDADRPTCSLRAVSPVRPPCRAGATSWCPTHSCAHSLRRRIGRGAKVVASLGGAVIPAVRRRLGAAAAAGGSAEAGREPRRSGRPLCFGRARRRPRGRTHGQHRCGRRITRRSYANSQRRCTHDRRYLLPRQARPPAEWCLMGRLPISI